MDTSTVVISTLILPVTSLLTASRPMPFPGMQLQLCGWCQTSPSICFPYTQYVKDLLFFVFGMIKNIFTSLLSGETSHYQSVNSRKLLSRPLFFFAMAVLFDRCLFALFTCAIEGSVQKENMYKVVY